jgi:hypothetical protein
MDIKMDGKVFALWISAALILGFYAGTKYKKNT